LSVSPELPAKWKRLAFSIVYKGLRLRFEMSPGRLAIQADPSGEPVALEVLGRPLTIRPGQRIERKLTRQANADR
jgi:trehalose/maltose hydrolase-like predicted phosphorylase